MALMRSQMGATGTRMHIDMVEYDDAWRRVGGNSFQLEKSFFNPHDFGMTPNHYVFFQARVQGRSMMLVRWEGSLDQAVGLQSSGRQHTHYPVLLHTRSTCKVCAKPIVK